MSLALAIVGTTGCGFYYALGSTGLLQLHQCVAGRLRTCSHSFIVHHLLAWCKSTCELAPAAS